VKRGELQCHVVRFWSPLWFYCPCLRYFILDQCKHWKQTQMLAAEKLALQRARWTLLTALYFCGVFFGDATLLLWKCFLLAKSTAMFWDYAGGNLPDLQCCARTSAVCSVCVKEVARIIGDRYVFSIRVQRRYEGWFTPRPCMEFADCTAFRFLAFEQL